MRCHVYWFLYQFFSYSQSTVFQGIELGAWHGVKVLGLGESGLTQIAGRIWTLSVTDWVLWVSRLFEGFSELPRCPPPDCLGYWPKYLFCFFAKYV